MGITAFFYAAEGEIAEVEKALFSVGSKKLRGLSGSERADGSTLEAIYKNEDGVELVLWQDGKFTCFAETTLLLFDEPLLGRLSKKVGTVIAVCIGDHGGSYSLHVYRNGRLHRSLDNLKPARGTAIPEEDGVSLTDFYEGSILKIWKAFGLTYYGQGVAPSRVFHAGIDRAGPWWKFW